MIEVFDNLEQQTEEWFRVRMGLPTASEFSSVISAGRGSAPSKTRLTYMYKLAGEMLSGEPAQSYTNVHMERGKEREAEARDMYCMMRSVDVTSVGFVRNGNRGCSPDGMIGDDGLIEIKDALPHIQIERLLDGGLPSEYVAQVQGQLMVCERKWCDFVSHSRGIRPLIVRVERDEEYIGKLDAAINRFVSELTDLVERLK